MAGQTFNSVERLVSMQITLADTVDLHRDRLAARLTSLPGVSVLDTCRNLTETFNSVEHRPPQILLCSKDLMEQPEFDAIRTLCSCLSTKCIEIGRPFSKSNGSGRYLDVSLPLPELTKALSDVMASDVPQPKGLSAGLLTSKRLTRSNRIVLIGSSTGGVDALLKVLSVMSADCPPTLIVQHTGASFGEGLARLLDRRLQPQVCVAKHGDRLLHGKVLLASGAQTHLKLSGKLNPVCALDVGDRISGHRPSVDALFSSAVPFASRITGVILTGMGMDGAKGLLDLRKSGAHTIGQDEATSVVYGMPGTAARLGAVAEVLPIGAIGPAILRSCRLPAQK